MPVEVTDARGLCDVTALPSRELAIKRRRAQTNKSTQTDLGIIGRERWARSLNMLGQSKSSRNAERETFPHFLIRQYGQILFALVTQTKSRSALIQIRIGPAEKSLTSYRPSGLEIGFPGGGVNSNMERVIGARLWFEYVVTIWSPLDFNISVRCTNRSPLSRRLKR